MEDDAYDRAVNRMRRNWRIAIIFLAIALVMACI